MATNTAFNPEAMHEFSDAKVDPECCLINFYDEEARMGLHQDKDETNFEHPVLSISLGDSALFRVGNNEKGGKTESVWLESGDIAILQGPSERHFMELIVSNLAAAGCCQRQAE